MSLIFAFFIAYFVWLFVYSVIGAVKRYKLDRAIERLPLIQDPDERRFLERERRRRKNEELGKRYGLDD